MIKFKTEMKCSGTCCGDESSWSWGTKMVLRGGGRL